ncbi:hypothetical protein [Bythopirellula polymerisocia]|uniref:DUF4398 domain-containing protein n=1 Tax=Bythopirellula polymerisocia TaxID=2528003 RepID=A0A5C6CTV2_9BACT|nr:hypothetical protein [Bythopirellula polymerisocia]TWU28050.1 hypothetical protein Pla144_13370 [Bythopirellula polymerisocia]
MKARCLALLLSTTMFSYSNAQVTQVQTVQLPTFHYFGVSTTVVVPTRGTVSLGSIGGSTRTRFDRVGSRSVGTSAFAGGLSVSATVIDLAEMDREVLAEAARRRGAKHDVLGRPVDTSATNWLEAQRAATYLRRGQTAEGAGQAELARVFYRRVAKHGSESERQIAEARLTAIESSLAVRPRQ